MKYTREKSRGGQTVIRSTVGGGQDFYYLEEGEITQYESNQELQNLVRFAMIGRSEAEKEGGDFTIGLQQPDGQISRLAHRWASYAEAKKAAVVMSYVFPAVFVLQLNAEYPVSRRASRSADPERYDRDYYEDNSLRRNAHPEEGSH